MSNKSWPEGQVAQDTLKSSKSVEGDISTTIYSWQESHKCSRNIPILAHRHATNFPGAGACLAYSTDYRTRDGMAWLQFCLVGDTSLWMWTLLVFRKTARFTKTIELQRRKLFLFRDSIIYRTLLNRQARPACWFFYAGYVNVDVLLFKWASIFKMWFFFKMCFHFQNVKGFVSVFFLFRKNTIVNKNL